jgi:hypothetical protein
MRCQQNIDVWDSFGKQRTLAASAYIAGKQNSPTTVFDQKDQAGSIVVFELMRCRFAGVQN